MIGENLRSITKIDTDKVCITTKESVHIFKARGDYGHEAWIDSIPEFIHRGVIRKINDEGYHFSIITDGGYNDIELRAEWGYEAGLSELS